MLWPVLGSSLLRASRLCLRLSLFGAVALGTLLPSAPAWGQQADDGGWFEPPAADPLPEPYYDAPDAGSAAAEPQAEVADTDPSALTTFRPALDPYGAWMSTPTYGTVWVPHGHVVGPDFAPYVSGGHWALTADDDWIWVSDYPFGWAVFHYGRWVWISGSGWAWVPGRTYANAWVVWRVPSAGYAYVGWAPMPPSWVWMHGSAVTLWYGPPVPYVFCPSAYAFDYHVHRHIVHDRRLVHRIAAHTRVYPTPYRAPARPSTHTSAARGVRAPAPAPSSAPRGPRMSAARVPAQAIPAERAARPENAARLSGARRGPLGGANSRARAPAVDSRARGSAAERLPADARRPATRQPLPRSAPSAPAPRSRAAAPDRTRAQPRSVAPARTRLTPGALRPQTPGAPRLRRIHRP